MKPEAKTGPLRLNGRYPASRPAIRAMMPSKQASLVKSICNRSRHSPVASRRIATTRQYLSTKRSNSGQLKSLLYTSESKHLIALPEGRDAEQINEGKEDNDLSSDSDVETLVDDAVIKNFELGPGHPFHKFRPAIVEFAYGAIRDWQRSARYAVPSEGQLRPRKRSKRTHTQYELISAELEDESDSQIVIVPRTDGYFHLACPFYASDPQRYESCLLQSGLQSVEAVIQHLQQHHAEAPYCPRCGLTFEEAEIRDVHLTHRTCEIASSTRVDGINKWQLARIAKRDRAYMGEEMRWLQIWVLIFPDSEAPSSPYLQTGAGRAASMIRDHWRIHGEEYIQHFLKNQDCEQHAEADTSEALTAMARLSLQDILKKVIEEESK